MAFFLLASALGVLALAELRHLVVAHNRRDRRVKEMPLVNTPKPLDVCQLFVDTPNDRIVRAREYMLRAQALITTARNVLRSADVPKVTAFVMESGACLKQAIDLADVVVFADDTDGDRPTVRTPAARGGS